MEKKKTRTPWARAGYRHGSTPRKLTKRSGAVELKVPRAGLTHSQGEEREWQSELIPRYRRSTAERPSDCAASATGN